MFDRELYKSVAWQQSLVEADQWQVKDVFNFVLQIKFQKRKKLFKYMFLRRD